jgi:hypothetical protein
VHGRLFSRALVFLLFLFGVVVPLGTAPTAQAGHAWWDTPVWKATLPGAVRESSPAPADLDGDGVLDVVVGALDGNVHALRGGNGQPVGGWPRFTGTEINSSPSIADTNGDGSPEVFIGSGISKPQPPPCRSEGAMWSFAANGATRFRVAHQDPCSTSLNIHSTPALGDINGDGVADATYGALGLTDWSINTANGGVNPGWPFYAGDTAFSSPALADVNGDGQTDVVIGQDSGPGGPYDHRGGFVRAISGKGQLLWAFPTNEIVRSSPSIGDIDGDGRPDIVFGTGDYWVRQPGGATDSVKIFALELNGQLKPGWPRSTNGYTMASPALADVTGDGRLDVVMGTWHPDNTGGSVFAFQGNGTPIWQRDSGGGVVVGSVTTADLNADGAQDVLVPTGAGFFAYDGRNGVKLFGLLEGQVSFQSSAAITDADNDGRLDIFIAGGRPGAGGEVYRFEMPAGPQLGAQAWPMFRKDARRTGSWTNPPLRPIFCGPAPREGYWLVASDGGIFSYCDAQFFGSTGGIPLNRPIVGMAATPTARGYWLVASDGGIFAFGDAVFRGSTGGIPLNQPIVGMAATPSGRGYWLVASDGGIFAFGDAVFRGSTGGTRLNQPIVGMAATPSGQGYWLVASDGGIFAYGDAVFRGSTGGVRLNSPIVGMAPTATGQGYWLVAQDGGIFNYGNAIFRGSAGGARLNSPIVDMAASPAGGGYWLVASDGGIFAYGVPFHGSAGSIPLARPIVGMAVPRV